MNTSDKRRFISYDAYEKLANAYAEMIDTKPDNAYLERPATLSLLPDVRGRKVLDAGCGPGAYSEWLVRHGAEVTAFDASPKMVGHAQKRLGSNVDIRLHDLREPLDFLEADSVDVVLAALVMDYIKDWVPVFSEFKRVLKKDGVFVFSVGHPSVHYFLEKIVEDYFRVEKIEILWKGFGQPVLVPSYRRPLQAMADPLHESGFLIDRIVEGRPTAEYRKADPEGYEEVSRRPSFICIRAIPRLS